MTLSHVVFDLDGTLIDSASGLTDALNESLGPVGCREVTLADTRHYLGHGATALVEGLLEQSGVVKGRQELIELVYEFRRVYALRHATSYEVYPGIEDLLDRLDGMKMPWSICTNKPAWPTEIILDHAGWRRRAHTVLCGDTFPVRKPNGLMLDALAMSAKCPATQFLMVGDSQADLGVAQAVQSHFAWAGWGYGAVPDEVQRSSGFASVPEFTARWFA